MENAFLAEQQKLMSQMLQTFDGVVNRLHQKVEALESRVQKLEQKLTYLEVRPANELSRFLKLQPPQFHGTSERLEAHNWLYDMEQIFGFLGCTDEEKVRYAIFLLKGSARDWWLMIDTGYKHGTKQYTWDEFKKVFLGWYSPDCGGFQKVREFLGLEQGDMSVAEYNAKFMECARFAPKELITEDFLGERFGQGLNEMPGVNFYGKKYPHVMHKAMVYEDFESKGFKNVSHKRKYPR